MVTRSRTVGVILARGGSKGVPRKNILPIGSHPLIAYTIASALAAKSVDRLIVSTDDDEIAGIARKYGAEVPFVRPAHLAKDDTTDFPVIEHALQWLTADEKAEPDIIVQLRPTSPLRPKGLLDEAVALLKSDAEADCVRAVTIPSQTPFKMWRESDAGYLVPLLQSEFEEPYNMPRQSLPIVYWQTGHVDVIRVRAIVEQKSLSGKRIRPVFVDEGFCVDIDTADDLYLVDQLIKRGGLNIDQPAR